MNIPGILLSVLMVGHSLFGLDTPQMLREFLKAGGLEFRVSAQIINGAPLSYNWNNGDSAQGVNARDVLANEKTDVLILTEAIPLDDHLKWSQTREHALAYYRLAVSNSPEVRVFLQETWPSGAGQPDWAEKIRQDHNKWRSVIHHVNAKKGLNGKPMALLPAGQAMLALSLAIERDDVPGVTSIDEFFDDEVHLNDRGHYFVAALQYAVLTGKSPVGLPIRLRNQWGNLYQTPDHELAARLQQIAWQVASGAETVLRKNTASADPSTDGAKATIGIGLTGVYDWSPQQPFLDVFKTARPWIVHKPGQWAGGGVKDLAAAGALDENGWVTRLPRKLGSVGTLILADLPPEAASLAGRYRLSFEGDGIVEVMGRATNKKYGRNEVSFDFTPGPGFVEIRLRRNDPNSIGDYVRNVTVVKEDYRARFEQGEIFNPVWIDRIKRFDTLRFMDWMGTNNSQQSRWQDRPLPDAYTYATKGVPLELMIKLANQTGTNVWFNLPHRADDDYVRDFARMVRDRLAPSAKVYVEYSNEVWNWMFDQTKWAAQQAADRWGEDEAGVQFYGMRAAQIAQIWSDVFATSNGPKPELINVISTQTGWLGLEDAILNAPLWQIRDGAPRPPAAYFDAYAITGYFGGILGTEDRAPMVREWLAKSHAAAVAAAKDQGLTGDAAERYITAHAYDLASERAGRELFDGAISGDMNDTLVHLLGRVWPYHARVAKEYGLDLVMYEGGTHLVGIGPVMEDSELSAFYNQFNYSPQMGELYKLLIEGWRRIGGGQFNAFADVGVPSKWGSWGTLRYLSDDNPRWQALVSAAECKDGCDGS